MGTALTLAKKDLSLLFRDKVGFFFTFFFPVIYASLFGIVFSGMGQETRALKVAVIDEDDTELSHEFIQRMVDGGDIDARRKVRAGDTLCDMDRETAANLVRKGRLVAYVILKEGFGESAKMPFWGGSPKIRTGIDPSRKAESAMLQGVLTRRYFERLDTLFRDPAEMNRMTEDMLARVASDTDMDPIMRIALSAFLPSLSKFTTQISGGEGNGGFGGIEPVVVEAVETQREKGHPKTSFDITFPQGIVWGIMGCAAAFGISLVVERNSGTLMRLRISPIRFGDIIAGKALACFLTTVTVAAFLFLFASIVFGLRPDSLPLLALAVASCAACFTGIMMLLSVLGKTEQAAGGIGWAILMVFAMIGGGMMPLMFMPSWMQTASNVSPVSWAIYAMEGAIFRGFSPAEMALPCGVLVAVGILGLSLGSVVFARMERT
ncbi:MAG: ABC transporter permease [Phycisphaerae bacterium]|nr:ABC transporter permease [Phycisphaerae bacterium]